MQPLRPTHHTPRPQARGSAIILVVISVILLALLGATYLQITRFERLAEPEQGNIETVLQSIIAKAATVMAEDIVKDTNQAFDSRTLDTGAPFGDISTAEAAGTGGIEPYDYAFTRLTATATPGLVAAADHNGTFNPEILVEDLDDPWLASSFLGTAGPSNGRFVNISNLCGYYIDTGPGTPDNLNYARVQQADFEPQRVTGASPPADTTQVADTDDDGFSDARWAWPPIFEIGGIEYVFAIRIIDLSARLNVNTALMGTDEDGGRVIGDPFAPRGTTPAELSFGGFASDGFGLTAAQMDQIVDTDVVNRRSFMDYRFGGPSTAFPLGEDYNSGPRFYQFAAAPADYDRLDHWVEGSLKMAASGTWNGNWDNTLTAPYQGFSIRDDLVDLLTRNGLNDGENSNIENPGGLSQTALLRAGAGESGTIASGFAGGLAGFFTGDARKWLTTHSGTGTLAPPLAPGDALDRKYNPIDADGEDLDDALAGLGYAPASGMAAGDFEAYLALSIGDAADDDNQPMVHDGKAGFEPLPMLTEVHLQVPYQLTSAPADPVVVMQRQTAGYAIEIGNPFRFPISLENITLRVDGDDWATLDTLVTGKDTLEVGELIVIYRDSVNTPANAYDDIQGRIRDAPLNTFGTTPAPQVFQVTGPEPWPTANTTDIAVELVVEAEDGSDVVYSRINTLNALNAEQTKTFDPWPGPAPAPTLVNEVRFLVENNQGNANLLNMLHTSADDIDTEEDATDVTDTAIAPGNAEAFGDANKINVGDVADEPTLAGEQFGIPPADRLNYLGDLALIPALGVNITGDQPIAEVWGAATSLTQHRLPVPGTGASVSAADDALRVDYLSLAMARLSAISPLGDGIDNDGNGTIDDEAVENFIPGTMNINSMPEFLISAVLPIPNAGVRGDIANRVIRYRDLVTATGVASDSATQRTAGNPALTRANPGIAYIGELFGPLAGIVVPDADPGEEMFFDGTTVPLDWNNADINGNGLFDDDDGITGDIDEAILFQKWLPQMFSTRSDVYAAYILINGYNDGIYDDTSLTETLRAIVIFQRANVQNAGDKATVLEVIRF
ncbi:MAG: hypothetical protein AAF797_13460 [Planctomycetota bacterium]